jgi:RNA polymerase sigma-70 factor, ECF subfamily
VATLTPETQASLLAGTRSSKAAERKAAFIALFAAMRREVFALALHVTGNRAEAEDAVQDCFLAVHEALPRFRQESALSTWVYRIALRSAWRVRSEGPRGARPLSEAKDEPWDGVAPDDTAADRQQAAAVHSAMQRLSVEHRTVLSLFAVEGLGHAEIAEVLGVPLGTVWSRLHVARKRLAQTLEEHAPLATN